MGLLLFYLFIPLLAIFAFLLTGNRKSLRTISFSAAGIQLILTIIIFILSAGIKTGGERGNLLLNGEVFWSGVLNISFAAGIDSISWTMLMLVSLVTFSVLFTDDKTRHNLKEFYILLFLVIFGANGLFISAGVFSMVVFTGISATSLYILIYSQNRDQHNIWLMVQGLTLAAGFALLVTGLTGLYMNSAPDGNQPTFNLQEVSTYLIPLKAQTVFFPMVFTGFVIVAGLFPFNLFLPRILEPGTFPSTVLYTGLLFNMGAYGALKASIFLMPEAASEMSLIFRVMAGLTVAYYITYFLLNKKRGSAGACIPGALSGMILFAMLLMNRKGIMASVALMISLGLYASLIPQVKTFTGFRKERSQKLIYILFLILVIGVPLAAILGAPAILDMNENGGISTIVERILMKEVI